MNTYYTKSSLQYVEGDIVEVGILHEGQILTYVGTLLKPTKVIIPNDKNQIATNIKRKFFTSSDIICEELQQHVLQGDCPENYELYQIVGFDVKIRDTPPENISDEYKAKHEYEDHNIIYTQLGLIRRRLVEDDMDNLRQEVIDVHMGAVCKATRYVRLDENNMEINEVVGKIVGFEFNTFGGNNFIVKITKGSGSKLKLIQNNILHEVLFKAYPKAEFAMINNDYKIEYSPSKIGVWRKEYLNALRTILYIDTNKKLYVSKIKAIKLSKSVETFKYGTDYWYAFTEDNHRIASDMQIIGLEFKENSVLKICNNTHNQTLKPNVGAIVCGFETKNNKENDCPNMVWFFAQDYPMFDRFYKFAFTNGEGIFKGKEPKDCVDMFKHRVKDEVHHTVFSKLISGYFNPKTSYDEVKQFRKKYLWYM